MAPSMAKLTRNSNERYNETRNEVFVRSSSIARCIVPLIQRGTGPRVKTKTTARTTESRSIARARHIAISLRSRNRPCSRQVIEVSAIAFVTIFHSCIHVAESRTLRQAGRRRVVVRQNQLPWKCVSVLRRICHTTLVLPVARKIRRLNRRNWYYSDGCIGEQAHSVWTTANFGAVAATGHSTIAVLSGQCAVLDDLIAAETLSRVFDTGNGIACSLTGSDAGLDGSVGIVVDVVDQNSAVCIVDPAAFVAPILRKT